VVLESVWLPRHLRRDGIDVFLGINQVLPPRLPCSGVCFVQNVLYYSFRDYCMPSNLGWHRSAQLHLRYAYYGLQSRRSFRRARRSIAVSESAREAVVTGSGVPPEKVDVVPLAPSELLGPHDTKSESGADSYFLMVGAITPYKNICRAVDAIALLRREGRIERLCIVGWDVWGYARTIREYAIRKGVGDLVRLVGPVDHRQLGAWYGGAQALLMLSACEAFPLPVLEAMTTGAAVIGSDRSAVPETVGTGGTIIDPEDIPALAACMADVASSCTRRAQLVAAGRHWAKRFSWERTARQIAASLRRSLHDD
jgi:glycosyltransferase involved in cell wall biosynthesis